MGDTYTRQSSYTDGDVITAAHTNDEFNQLLAAFAASSGHTHDGTTGEGGPVSALFSNTITLGANNDNDIVLTFDANSSNGVLSWKEDEDYFEFSDDILIASTEKIQFRDTGLYIYSSVDGQLDIVADTEVQIAATTIDINGAVDISGNLDVGGNLVVTGTTTFNGGTITMGDAATDNVVFGADIDSNIIPDDDDTYDLGSASQQWRNLFIDGTANIDALVADTADINSGSIDGVTLGTNSAITQAVIDNVNINGATIGHTDDTDLITLADGIVTVAGEISVTTLDIGGVNVTASAADINLIDGITNGTVIASKAIITDSNNDISGGRNITISGELDAGSLDISGDADIDGTLEADAITIGGVTLAETISDTVGAMVSGNTETNIAVSYDDADNTLDFVIGTLNQDTTGNAATATVLETARTIGGTSFNGSANIAVGLATAATTVTVSDNESTNENNVILFGAGAAGSGNIGVEADGNMTYNPSTGKITATGFVGALTGDVAGNLTGTVATATQNSITTATGLTSTGALNAGSITSGFGAIDNGASAITTTGVGSFGSLDISGNIDVDGTTNLDVVDVDGAVNFAADVTFADGADIITASAGTSNFRAGVNAGNSITSGGNYNTVVGDEAGTAITTGDFNVAIGYKALFLDTLGSKSVAIGEQALTTQNFTSATDAYNVAVGRLAGEKVTTGQYNTLIGGLSGDAITTASSNTAVGFNALGANTTGAENVALGDASLQTNTTASYNTAVGRASLLLNTTGANNTATGYKALRANTTASNNTAVGYHSLLSNTTGADNVAIGKGALDANTTAADNTAVGSDAMTTNTTGTANVAVGTSSLASSTTSDNNTAVGQASLSQNTTGFSNVAVGKDAGDSNTTGDKNILVGVNANSNAATGDHAIVIGHDITGSPNDFSFGKASNIVSNDFDADANWSRSSDERLKKNITNQSLGLDFINDLRTVKYNWKPSNELDASDPQLAHLRREDEDGNIINEMNTDVTMHNFIAQEVKTALDTAGVSDFGGWKEDNNGVQQVSREMFVIPLVKAVQELSAQVTALTARITELEG